ncbi:MAG: AmmeMemoRadiSam system protein A [Desulfopila sp.]
MSIELNPAQAGQLLQLARRAIEAHLRGESVSGVEPPHPVFAADAATFVTLKLAGRLRGCIGTLEPRGTLWRSVHDNALSAAFHDSRFSPLSASELARVQISIAILGHSEEVEYRSGDELLALLRPGVDGVTLGLGRARATFLPQVWDDLPEPSRFLAHLCQKAGLPAECWRNDRPRVERYQVCYYEEKRG